MQSDRHRMPVCILECRDFQWLCVTLQLLLWKGSCRYKFHPESLGGAEAICLSGSLFGKAENEGISVAEAVSQAFTKVWHC